MSFVASCVKQIASSHRTAAPAVSIGLNCRPDMHMVDNPNGVSFSSRNNEAFLLQVEHSILTLKTPNVEEIARAIWQRQHDALAPDAIFCDARWRDPSIPSKFWDEFLLDAHAVLSLLYKKHIKYQHKRI